MTKLTNTARTILRSRIRRHPQRAATIGDIAVSAMTNGDLIQSATLLGLHVPTEAECDAYADAINSGKSALDAMTAADREARGAGQLPVGQVGTVDTDADATNEDANDVDLTIELEERRKPAPAAGKAEATGDIATKAKASADALLAKMGSGDFEGFKTGLLALATEAHKPAQIQTIVKTAPAPIDPTKIKGHVPQVMGKRTAYDAKMPAAFGLDAATVSMDVYDAPDAPAIDPDYRWPQASATIVAMLDKCRPVMLWGPAGTGKTSFAKQIAAQFGRPYARISCTETTEAETLVGMTVPDSANGGVKWQDGQLTAAIRKPGTVVHIDEMTVARPGALFVLQSVMDDERALFIAETGEYVPMAPGVVVIVTDNTNGTGDTTGAYESTRIMNRATLDRLAVTVKLDFMAVTKEAAALSQRTGCPRKLALILSKFAALTRRDADVGKVSHGITLRRLIALADLLTVGVDPDAAFQMSVIETAPHDDREPLRQLWTAEVKKSELLAAAK